MTLSDAYLAARGRGVLPTSLSTAESRLAFSRALRARSVWSARTTHLPYLSILRNVVETLLRTETAEGESFGQAEARLALKQALTALHYDPERGHFGTPADADIPPAERGSLQDLSSDRRLNLIIDTQRLLYQSAAQNDRGLEPGAMLLYPCWELVRGTARVPRGDWPDRWSQAGGTLHDGRMIAPKGSPVWDALGNGSTFPDALDTETPPFAFGSTRRWTGVSRSECVRLGIPLPGLRRRVPQASGKPPAEPLPDAPPGQPVSPPAPAPAPAPAPTPEPPAPALPLPQAPVPPQTNPTVLEAVETVTATRASRGRLSMDEIAARSIARRRAAYEARQ